MIGSKILHYAQVESTNDIARAFAERGEPEGLVVTAEQQIAGRGRLGRKWIVPPATSLQFSVLLRPRFSSQKAWQLTPMAGIAVARTLEQELKLKPQLKWPNDVLVTDRKVAGILAETSLRGEQVDYCILGIGLNVNYAMTAFPELAPFATTLQDLLGYPIDRAALQASLLQELDRMYALVQDADDILVEYRARLGMLGKAVRVASLDKVLSGIARDVAPDGALVLRSNGLDVNLYAGDVTILKNQEEE
jgi:BirA family transcriptional regulator, biotin operon repressor / biotin---[acetyl-CoA-carboxylase] ligase